MIAACRLAVGVRQSVRYLALVTLVPCLAGGCSVDGHAVDAALPREQSALDFPPEVHRLPAAHVGGEVDVMSVTVMAWAVIVSMDVHAPVESLYRLVAENKLLSNEDGTGEHLVEMLSEFLHADVMVTGDEHLVRTLAWLPDGVPHGEVTDVTEMDDGVILVDGLPKDVGMLLRGDPVGIHEGTVVIVEVGVADDEYAAGVAPVAERLVKLLYHDVPASLAVALVFSVVTPLRVPLSVPESMIRDAMPPVHKNFGCTQYEHMSCFLA